MRILADENVHTENIRALLDSGHDVVRVVDDPELGESAPDPAVLERATQRDRVLLTQDNSDFGDPPIEEHAGIVLLTDETVSGSGVRRGIRRIERQYPDLRGAVAHLKDWI
jgi:predicted nuclease of predicted toxin-antitoxin system